LIATRIQRKQLHQDIHFNKVRAQALCHITLYFPASSKVREAPWQSHASVKCTMLCSSFQIPVRTFGAISRQCSTLELLIYECLLLHSRLYPRAGVQVDSRVFFSAIGPVAAIADKLAHGCLLDIAVASLRSKVCASDFDTYVRLLRSRCCFLVWDRESLSSMWPLTSIPYVGYALRSHALPRQTTLLLFVQTAQ
jgi:hypothetical protein